MDTPDDLPARLAGSLTLLLHQIQGEAVLFRQHSEWPAPHARLVMSAARCNQRGGSSIDLFGQAVLYEDGQVLVHLAHHVEDQETGELVDSVNTPMRPIESFEISEGMTNFMIQHSDPWARPLLREFSKEWLRRSGRVVWPAHGDISGTLQGYVADLFQAIGSCLSPRRGARHQWTWFGAVGIHLRRFEGQRSSAAANRTAFSTDLSRIQQRHRLADGRRQLLRVPRAFDDLDIFVGNALMMWVYTPEAAQQPPASQQVLLEWIAYQRGLQERVMNSVRAKVSDQDLIDLRRRLLLSREQDLLATAYGDVREYIRVALEAWEINRLRDDLSEILDLLESQSRARKDRRFAMFGLIVTVLVGVGALPSLVSGLGRFVERCLALAGVHLVGEAEWNGSLVIALLALTLAAGSTFDWRGREGIGDRAVQVARIGLRAIYAWTTLARIRFAKAWRRIGLGKRRARR